MEFFHLVVQKWSFSNAQIQSCKEICVILFEMVGGGGGTPIKVKVNSILKFVYFYLECVRLDYNKQFKLGRQKRSHSKQEKLQLLFHYKQSTEILVICIILSFIELGILNSSLFPLFWSSLRFKIYWCQNLTPCYWYL